MKLLNQILKRLSHLFKKQRWVEITSRTGHKHKIKKA